MIKTRVFMGRKKGGKVQRMYSNGDMDLLAGRSEDGGKEMSPSYLLPRDGFAGKHPPSLE